MSQEILTRIAIVNADKCKPRKCRQECKRSCPVVRMGKLCIEVSPNSQISWISEELCIGCGICVKKCPFEAIDIINLPKDLDKDTTHRYGPNAFKLHRLPMPRPGQVLGLVGTNGIGKSTALKILAGKLKPNLGRYNDPPDWQEILRYFRGSELQNFLTKTLEENIKAVIKPQYVDHIANMPSYAKVKLGTHLEKKDERGVRQSMSEDLDLGHIQERLVEQLSGGELQRFAIALCAVQEADIYMFDEPSSYLDVRQRLRAAQTIRSLCNVDTYVVVVEHDLSVLDYLSDFVCCLYGKPGAYGVVTMPFSVREGINIFLAGFVPTENLRFRPVELTFKVAENVQDVVSDDQTIYHEYKYPAMTKNLGDFKLHVEEGSFTNSHIIVMLGQNGTGKTTFIRMLAGLLEPDEGPQTIPVLNVSYKPQKISPKFEGTVRQLLTKKIRASSMHPQFNTDVMKPLKIEEIIDQEVKNLSGGELQRVAITLALGKPADIYLIDEPSAYLDSEQRIVAAKVIKRFMLHAKKAAFIVEHDFIMATYLADRVIVYSGDPGRECTAHSPQVLLTGMNRFLKSLEITFRRDPTNHRPRINKLYSVKDQEQKRMGTYFYLDTDEEKDEDDKPRVGGVAGGSASAALRKEKTRKPAKAKAAKKEQELDLGDADDIGPRIERDRPDDKEAEMDRKAAPKAGAAGKPAPGAAGAGASGAGKGAGAARKGAGPPPGKSGAAGAGKPEMAKSTGKGAGSKASPDEDEDEREEPSAPEPASAASKRKPTAKGGKAKKEADDDDVEPVIPPADDDEEDAEDPNTMGANKARAKAQKAAKQKMAKAASKSSKSDD